MNDRRSMEDTEWQRVAIVNVRDDVGAALLRFFLAEGADVLAVDDEDGLANLPKGPQTLLLPRGAGSRRLEKDIRDGLQRWGRPQLLVNNFGLDFLQAHTEGDAPEWELVDDDNLRRGLAAISALLSLADGSGETLILNVGKGRGLIPEGCPMHFTLLGLLRSLSLMGRGGVRVANVCLHNLEGMRPECRPCAEEVLYPVGAHGDRRLRSAGEMVVEAIRRYKAE